MRKRYWIRSGKYGLFLVLLFFGLYGLMRVFGSAVSWEAILSSDRWWKFALAVVGFALVYPFVGYVRRRLTFRASERVEEVERVMGMCGFRRVDPEVHGDNEMVFEAEGVMKRASLMWEDRIVITTDREGASWIEGQRKEAVRAAYRMGTFIA